MVSVCFAGVTGWTAPAIVAAIDQAGDLTLSSGVSRSAAGQSLAAAAGSASQGSVYATVAEALESSPVDVLIDYKGWISAGYQRSRCTTSPNGRRLGFLIGASGRSAG
jgi:4-hydroxy-tetrahydrodipicolinate reductase